MVRDEIAGQGRAYGAASDEVVDLTNAVASARPHDLEVPAHIAALASYAVPTLLDIVRRREVIPPMLAIAREGEDPYTLEPIEEELGGPADLLAYMQRRIESDRDVFAMAAEQGLQETVLSPMLAYGCMFDERNPGFSTDPSIDPDDDANLVLCGLFGCVDSPQGISVRQRFRPKLFGGAALLGAPIIEAGPDSLLA